MLGRKSVLWPEHPYVTFPYYLTAQVAAWLHVPALDAAEPDYPTDVSTREQVGLAESAYKSDAWIWTIAQETAWADVKNIVGTIPVGCRHGEGILLPGICFTATFCCLLISIDAKAGVRQFPGNLPERIYCAILR